ncbi:MAG TPA: cytochrome b/b6 domain-containing protein [Steroidobacter sp.]|nr:cytochrome b/b6 domain-containing protein [Steroidobacter sp.]
MSATPIEVAVDTQAAVRHESAVRVWDLPVRIFHWSLVVAIVAAYVTSQLGGEWMRWHGRIGSFVLALLVFRLIWGFIGTPHARFAGFVPTPNRLIAYFKGQWRGVGHSPLGALSVIALLTLVAAQVVTGLFSNDDIAFSGPWAHWIAKGTSERLTGWHEQIFNALAGFILLHVLAIAFYLVARRSNLVAAMITGNKVLSGGAPEAAAAMQRPGWRLIAAVMVAVSVPWLIFREIPPAQAQPVAAPAATADW